MRSTNTTPERGHDHSHIRLSYVMAVYFDRDRNSALTDLLRVYASYGSDILARIQFVIVDDGSPIPVTIPKDLDLNILLLRIAEDIPWNQPGARNLGVVYARSDKLLLMDLDHEMPEATLRHIVDMRNPGRTVYKMRRVDPLEPSRRPHPNSFVLSRARLLRFFGYDEEFTGHYGFDDSMLWRWQRNNGTRFLYLPRTCHIVCRNLDREKTHSLERDLSFNKTIADRKKHQWQMHGYEAGHSRQFLGFTWSIVEDRHRRTPIPTQGKHPLWTKTWWWRWVFGGNGPD